MRFDTAYVNKKETTFGENVSSSREVALVEVKLRRWRLYSANYSGKRYYVKSQYST